MTARKVKAKAAAKDDPKALRITAKPDVSSTRQLAEVALDPAAHALTTAMQFNKGNFGELDVSESYAVLSDQAKAVQAGDLSHQRAMLAGQASSLNSIFTEMARRAGINMGEHLQATQLYMRLALKAQSQCRATIEALDRLANGHVQTVKHVHVNEGGQAVIADQFHHHTGGQGNGRSDGQPHATGAAGTGPALSGPDALGQPMPIPSHKGEPAMQDARRQR